MLQCESVFGDQIVPLQEAPGYGCARFDLRGARAPHRTGKVCHLGNIGT